MKLHSGEVAIVTGAASGIGYAIAKHLLQEGFHVACLDVNKDGLERHFSDYGDFVINIGIDLTKEEDVFNAVNLVEEKFSKIDILINCAGITGNTNILSHMVDTENLKKVFDLNFMASYYTSKAVLPNMIKNNYGRIVHLASIAGKEGNAGMLAYSASKAAVIGMTKVQGKEYGELGITVNAIAPAVIYTPLVEAMPAEQVKYMTDKIPMKRCGTLKEITDLICFIISPNNSFTTGFTFDLSGGRATY